MKMIRKVFKIYLFLVVSLLLTCKETDINLLTNIQGIITDASTNLPISGAGISTVPATTTPTTDFDGKYMLNQLETKEYTIQVSKEGYETAKKTISTIPGQTANADFALISKQPILGVSTNTLDFGTNLTTLPIEIKNN
jgi:hypothetical protein